MPKVYPLFVNRFIREIDSEIAVNVIDKHHQSSFSEGAWKANLRDMVNEIIKSDTEESYLVCFETDDQEGHFAMKAEEVVDWLYEHIEKIDIVRVDMTKVQNASNKAKSFVLARK